MCRTENCYETCINASFLISHSLWRDIEKILSNLPLKSKTGRPPLLAKRAINGVYYLLKTGIHWKALPRCFGSSSALHRFFQKLISLDFFKKIWAHEVEQYDLEHGLNLKQQAADCSFRKSPLGCEKTGKSPVDRRKLGSKLSTISESKGIVIGLALGAANEHDSTLLPASLASMPSFLKHPLNSEMHLDAAYDSPAVRTALFNFYYVPKIAPNQRRSKIKSKNPIGYERWFIEPVHAWMNKYRAIFVRYCKKAENYLALAQFAVAVITFKKI